MKKFFLSLFALLSLLTAEAQNTPTSQMETLDRGLIAVPSSNGMFVSWRLLGTDDEETTTFTLLRDGKELAKDVYKTNYLDANGKATHTYSVVTKVNGEAVDTSKTVTPWANDFLTIPMQQPAKGKRSGTYTPNDCSVGDVDGDGEYEIILKWDPSNSHDNSENGLTDAVILDCYKLNGTHLWRIDLGLNIRAGAHYTQFMVYDFDGDGKAEMMCKTALGSKDGKGNFVNQAATDETIKGHDNSKTYVNSKGHIITGPEYLTVFNGLTGEAMHTIWYLPNRSGAGGSAEDGSALNKSGDHPSGSDYWGDSYGGRSERYLGAVAYLDGPDKNPCGIFCRGYYTRAFVWAVSFDGEQLHTKWLHDSAAQKWYVVFEGDNFTRTRYSVSTNTGGLTSSDGSGTGSCTLYGNGNHNLSVADVDGDGCDEIIWGAGAVDDDGKLLYATGYGHGDAIHLSDLMPDRTGLELFDVHEDKVKNGKGSWDIHDAATGEIIYFGGSDGVDNGRGIAADVSSKYHGFEFWSEDGARRSDTGNYASVNNASSKNFRIYWDGTLYDQLLDGHYTKVNDVFDHVDQVNIVGENSSKRWTDRSLCNTTKMTPNLSGDILGDWREELVLWDYNNPANLYIHATTTATEHRMPTLMHDHTYRMAIAWQNTAYNQPPHLGYFLPDAMKPHFLGEKELKGEKGDSLVFTSKMRYVKSMSISASFLPDGTKKTMSMPTGFSKMTFDKTTKVLTFGAKPEQIGTYKLAFSLLGLDGSTKVVDTVYVNVTEPSGIHTIAATPEGEGKTVVVDMSGRIVSLDANGRLPKGIFIIRKQTANGTVTRKVINK